MKTCSQRNSVSSISFLLCSLFCAVLISCSKKSDKVDPFITTQPATITSIALNGCTLSSGNTGTRFYYSILYKVSPGVVIDKVEYTSEYSNGSKFTSEYAVTDGTSGTISRSICIRFASATWGDFNFTLVSSTGLKSNPSSIRIDKPAGAQ